jgi:CRISPR-associated protein Cas2
MLNLIVTYDITSDKARKKVSECCLDYGLDRQQYSVFCGRLKPTQIRALAKALGPLLSDGHVMIVPVAADDWDKRIELGETPDHDDE